MGEEVYRLWKQTEHRMFNEPEMGWVMVAHPCQRVCPENILCDNDFNNLVAEMKKCGRELSHIIKAVAAAEKNAVKIIEI